MKLGHVLVPAILASIPTAAFGSWNNTEWGMTPDQVATASNGQAPLSEGVRDDLIPKLTVGNVGQYQYGKYAFRSVYYYQSGSLNLVRLELKSGDCNSLRRDLEKTHGKPLSESNKFTLRTREWHDASNNNYIQWMAIGEVCTLRYKELAPSNAAGS